MHLWYVLSLTETRRVDTTTGTTERRTEPPGDDDDESFVFVDESVEGFRRSRRTRVVTAARSDSLGNPANWKAAAECLREHGTRYGSVEEMDARVVFARDAKVVCQAFRSKNPIAPSNSYPSLKYAGKGQMLCRSEDMCATFGTIVSGRDAAAAPHLLRLWLREKRLKRGIPVIVYMTGAFYGLGMPADGVREIVDANTLILTQSAVDWMESRAGPLAAVFAEVRPFAADEAVLRLGAWNKLAGVVIGPEANEGNLRVLPGDCPTAFVRRFLEKALPGGAWVRDAKALAQVDLEADAFYRRLFECASAEPGKIWTPGAHFEGLREFVHEATESVMCGTVDESTGAVERFARFPYSTCVVHGLHRLATKAVQLGAVHELVLFLG